MAAFIELPEFMTGSIIERTYKRAMALQNLTERDHYARRMLEQGLRRARARDSRMLLFLEHGANYLQHRNDEQKSRFAQQGYENKNLEFSEFSQWRSALELLDAPRDHADVNFGVFRWVYAAIAEALS